MAKDPLAKIPYLYHFCDTRNVPLIRKLGGLYSLEQLEKKGIKIPAPGGNEWSHDEDKRKDLHKFVHLCFRNVHPMEYRAKEDGRIAQSIFLQVHGDVLKLDGVRYTRDVSNKRGVKVYTLEEAKGMIDFEVIYTRTDWKDPAIKARLDQAEKCEILVPDFIRIDLIRNLPK